MCLKIILEHADRFGLPTSEGNLTSLVQRFTIGNGNILIERRKPFYLKFQDEMECHTTFYLGKNLITFTVTQNQGTIEDGCASIFV